MGSLGLGDSINPGLLHTALIQQAIRVHQMVNFYVV